MAQRTQSTNNLDSSVTSATANTVRASGLAAYASGYHVAIVSSTNGAAGQMRFMYASVGASSGSDDMYIAPDWDIVPADGDDISVAKNQDNYNSDYGNDFKLLLKSAAEWDIAADGHLIGDGTDHMVGGVVDQGFSQDQYLEVFNGSYFAMGYAFGNTSLGGWYWNSNNDQSTLGYQYIRVNSSATFFMANTNCGTVYAHAAFFDSGSYAYFYDASFTNLMYNGFRLKGHVYGNNLKFTGTGTINDKLIVASTIATFDGPLTTANSYGVFSSAVNQTLRINKYTPVNNIRDISAATSTIWEFVNPVWDNPIISQSVSSHVYEIFTIDANIQTTAGSAIASSVFIIVEGSAADRETYVQTIANASGVASDEIITTYWQKASVLFATATTTYGPFTARTWKYNYDPFEGALIVDQALTPTIAMGDDNEITNTVEASAIAYGSTITVREYTNPLYVVQYASGSAVAVSAVVSGATSGNEGLVQEKVGTTEGVFVLGSSTGDFTNDEDLYVAGSKVARANVSSFSEDYTWEIYCNSEPLTTVYDYQMALLATQSTTVDAWVSTARQRSTKLMDSTGGVFSTESYFSTGVWLTDRGTGTVDYMTSDAGVQYVPPASYSFTLTDLQTDSEVRIYASTAGGLTLLDGTESSGTTFTYNYTYGGTDVPLIVVVFSLEYADVRFTTLSLSNENQSIPVSQRIDRSYANP